MNGGELARRVRVLLGFALLLATCMAAPVLAQATSDEAPAAEGAPAAEEGSLPGEEASLEEAAASEEPGDLPQLQREEVLESPQASAEREDSEYAYAALSPEQEGGLLQEQFAPLLEAIDADPARVLGEVTLGEVYSPTEALVTVEGQTVLLESEVPLRTPEEDGDLSKVDLGLEPTPTGFEPANPIVDLELPGNAQEPIRIGDEGLAITPVGTTAAPAVPLGEEDLLLPSAREDTSLLLSPIAGGLELSAMLASRNSPQQLAFEVSLPAGTQLRAGESGGAEVVEAEGGVVATVSAPRTVDAQGTEVPTTLSVEGSTLAISVLHQEMDVAYPLFVDPEIIEDWSGFADGSKLNHWQWGWGGGVGPEDFIGMRWCITQPCWGNGLYIRARSNFQYWAGNWARWWFTPQGQTTFMHRVILGPVNYEARGCTSYEPHPYVGVWNDYTGWKVLSNAYPTGWGSYIDTGGQHLGPGTRTVFAGIHAGATVKLACGRDYRLGGATLFLDDPEQPTAHPAWGYNGGWIKNGDGLTIHAPASDPGLGVHAGYLSLGGSVPMDHVLGCNGHYSNPCPANHTFQFPVGAASLDQGEKTYRFSVNDALGKTSNTQEWAMKVDRSPPEISLSGELAVATDEVGKEGEGVDTKDKPLPLPVYNLTIDASDGRVGTPEEPLAPEERRSGVKKIEVFLNGSPNPLQTFEAPPCPDGNCSLSRVFTLKLNEITAGKEHDLRLVATDFAGNAPRVRELEFEYIPATGMKDEYVMQYFPLPDGSGNEDEEERPSRPELAVNVVSGNLVYRQEDADVEGPGADLELELHYNSLLPEAQNTEWGDGWTLAQTPELEIEEPGAPGPPTEASIVEESGAVESKVKLPTATGGEIFDKRLQATVAKEAGGYELTDESGETGDVISFSASGRAEELSNGTSGTVDYAYEDGDLAEITVEDPGTAHANPASIAETEVPDLSISHAANFGTAGSSAGELQAPADVAVDSRGNLWVLDRDNNRVQKFAPNGQFVMEFGEYGGGNGQFQNPTALVVDAAGNVLVADYFRIQKFSPSGQFLSKIFSYGFNLGQFALPNGLAVGDDGSIWVSDSSGVQRFTPGWQPIEHVGASGPGQLSSPQGLATAPNGEVAVADGSIVKVFDGDGDFVRAFGSWGSGPGQLQEAAEVEVDHEGNTWVADSATNRIQVFDAAGEHVKQFGSPGAGPQQFQFEETSGIAADRGRIWIADPGNNRIERWQASPITSFFHSANFGAGGSADGEMDAPADVVTDSNGNLWVLDRGNGRLQKFGPDGQFLSSYGSRGSQNGQFNGLSALALDAGGNVLVADIFRVQKFSPDGQFLSSFSPGELFIWGVTVGHDGAIWVSRDAELQRFTPQGQLIEQVVVPGVGQFTPQGLDTAPNGDVVVAAGESVKVFDENGDFVRGFGVWGNGSGQFQNANEVHVDEDGNIWVADSDTNRIQLFNGAGDHVAQFGSTGSGSEQLQLAQRTGIAVDEGRIWVADGGNDRIAEWVGGIYEPSTEPVLTEDDPQLEVEVSDGLVDSVEGEEVGTIDYEHSDDLLTAVSAPDGEADFAYDSAGRMTKVTLANGTYGEITYEPTYGRVKSVTVAVEGNNPRTTYFEYSDDPRRTTVYPSNDRVTTYDIGPDGGVLKWRNVQKPPVFDYLAGTLYDPNNRETAHPIAVGAHTLSAQVHDEEGIASIQFIANGNQLIDERKCDLDPTNPAKCATFTNEWVTETGNWPPGILHLEVIATDRLGEAVSERFWVNIPYTPPPDPEAEEPPRFSDILRFREEFGLDLDLNGNEEAIHDRIFELMGDWRNPNTPAGRVARATYASWGAPMRPIDAAEMELRERYIARAATAIPEWADAIGVGSDYAGYYVSHRQGGLIYVGFTNAQQARVAALVQSGLPIPPNRFRPTPSIPTHSLITLQSLAASVMAHPIAGLISTRINLEQNRVDVGAADVAQMQSHLASRFGPQAPFHVFLEPDDLALTAGVEGRPQGRVKAGESIEVGIGNPCSAGFGAWDRGGQKPTGSFLNRYFILTAGHCFQLGQEIHQWGYHNLGEEWDRPIGTVSRTAWGENPSGDGTDALAVRLADPSIVPNMIRWSFVQDIRVQGVAIPREGMVVCISGAARERSKCRDIEWPPERKRWVTRNVDGVKHFTPFLTTVPMGVNSVKGDSGGPIWERGTGFAVGTTTGQSKRFPGRGYFTPLKIIPGYPSTVGSLQSLAAGGEPLKVVTWDP
jgi:YD repeat-containing protein